MYFKSRFKAPILTRTASRSRRLELRARRRGVSAYMFALAFPMMIGLLGIVIDLGSLYNKRAQAQRAADAAAIAGAMEDPKKGSIEGKAREYARLNGYEQGVNNARVVIFRTNTPRLSDVRVVVSRREPVYFAPILEGFLLATGQSKIAAQFSRNVSAVGTATRRTTKPLPLGLGGFYGTSDPAKSPTNNSVFGPDANYNFGDAYSVKYAQNGTPNEYYKETGGVGEYDIDVSAQYLSKYKDVEVQIFDPDCYGKFDEIRPPNKNIRPLPTGPETTVTQYELVDEDGAAVRDVNGAIIQKVTYGGDSSTDSKWITPPGFRFKPAKPGKYKLRVKSLSGSSENGFQLRAGPSEGANKPDEEWNKLYGDDNGTKPNDVAVPMSASDHLQINFSRNGTVKFRLGYVEKEQSGKNITVSKFDIDSGATSIIYTCDTLPGISFKGIVPKPGDGIWTDDDIKVPAGYTGGNWYAEYASGAGDSTTWKLSGQGDGKVQVRLTK